jgi:hypothetical protein
MSRFASSRIAAVIAVLLCVGIRRASGRAGTTHRGERRSYHCVQHAAHGHGAGRAGQRQHQRRRCHDRSDDGIRRGHAATEQQGSFTYTPSSYFTGPDLLYRAVNTLGMGNTASSDHRRTSDGSGCRSQTTIATLGANGAIRSTTRCDGKRRRRSTFAATPELLTQPAWIGLVVTTGLVYTPVPGFSGTDTVTHRCGTSWRSAPATVTFVCCPRVRVPVADFRVVAMSGNAVTFSWTPPTSGPAATGYRLDGGIAAGTTLGTIPLGAAPRATVTLPTGSFYVRARTLAGAQMSPSSNEVPVHVNVPVPPSPPTNLIGGATWNSLNLAWLPGFAGGPPTGAVLEVSGAAAAVIPLGNVDTYALDNVPPGTYTLALRQTGPVAPASAPVTLTFPSGCLGAELPRTPTTCRPTSWAARCIHWEPATGGPAAAAYRLQVYDPFTGSLPVAGRSFSTTPPPGVYQFAVVAVNACGESPPRPHRPSRSPDEAGPVESDRLPGDPGRTDRCGQ